MHPKIKTIPSKKLLGIRLTMSLVQNKTGALWGSFMPRRKEISNAVSKDLFSLQVYPHSYFEAFNPAQEFEKWASVEVSDFEHIPANMETFVLPGGLYAVFEHKGSGYDNSIFQFIYGTWLPASEYLLDERPHFEVLGEKYKNNDPDSEEEIWIPIKLK
jgi:AraC family transcriptional regulator